MMGKSVRVWLACSVFVAIVCVVSWFCLQPGPLPPVALDADRTSPAPETGFTSVAFSGHLKCAECHGEIHQSHMTTPHSRTFSTTLDSEIARALDGSAHFGGDRYGEYRYELNQEGLEVSLKDHFSGRSFPLNFAVGSGKHAVTFLTLLEGGSETVAVEHRMTWFRNGERVGITPGQTNSRPDRSMTWFGKVIHGDEMHRCVNCHVTTGKIVGAGIQNLTAGVHCERCHGPGAEHAAAAAAGDMATALSAIQSRWTGPEEVAMCGDCHRMPHDISSDMLKEYPSVVTRFQPIGLLQSRCYTDSDGALRCTTCHDSHASVESRSMDRQTESCRSCHSTERQTLCAAGEISKCIDCHMPAIELVPGVKFHDHWIRVRTDNPNR
jgi:predicted CXXCH cytochrome family protein